MPTTIYEAFILLSMFVMANLSCQLDCLWTQLKPKQPVRIFLIEFKVRRPALGLSHTFWWPISRGIGEGSFYFSPACSYSF